MNSHFELPLKARPITVIALGMFSLHAWPQETSCLGAAVFREASSEPAKTAPLVSDIANILTNVTNIVDFDSKINVKLYRHLGSPLAVPNCSGTAEAGTIVLDVEMLNELANIDDSTEVLLSHEVGHILQFEADSNLLDRLCRGERFETKTYELLADFTAGYVIASLRQQGQSRTISKLIAQLADYQFSDPTHHGTVSDRVNAWSMGQHAAFMQKPMNMSTLLSNAEVFTDVLGGPPSGMTPAQQQRFIESAIEAIYK